MFLNYVKENGTKVLGWISQGNAWLTEDEIITLYGPSIHAAEVKKKLSTLLRSRGDEFNYYHVYDVLLMVPWNNTEKIHFSNWLRNNQIQIRISNTVDCYRNFSERLGTNKVRSQLRNNSWAYVFHPISSISTYVNILLAIGSTLFSVYQKPFNGNEIKPIVFIILQSLLLGGFLWLQFSDNEKTIKAIESLHKKLREMYPEGYENHVDGKTNIVTGLPKGHYEGIQSAELVGGAVFGALSLGTFFFKRSKDLSPIFGAMAPIVSSTINTFISKRLNLELSVTKSIINNENDEEVNIIAPRHLT